MSSNIPLNKMKVIYVHPSQLKGAIFEPEKRLYQDESFWILVAWIKKVGILEPVLATPDLTLINGHRRHAAAVYLGMSEMPVIISMVGLQAGFAATNAAQKNMVGAQWLDAHAKGMDLVYIRAKEAKQIQWLQNSIGEDGIKKLAALGVSPEIVSAAKALAGYLGWTDPKDLASIIWWFLDCGMQRPSIDARKTEPPTPPRVFVDAIRRKKPLQQFWGVAEDADSGEDDDDDDTDE